ncbi:hypothetical protein AKJ16_DCAP14767 [Drosera capensis]
MAEDNKGTVDISSPLFLHHSDNPCIVLVAQPLTDTNYPAWSQGMLTALSIKNKLGFIIGSVTKPDPTSSQYSLSDRCNIMEENQAIMCKASTLLLESAALAANTDGNRNDFNGRIGSGKYGRSKGRGNGPPGHVQEKCYKLHGYPEEGKGKATTHTVGSPGRILLFINEQYNQLLALINPNTAHSAQASPSAQSTHFADNGASNLTTSLEWNQSSKNYTNQPIGIPNRRRGLYAPIPGLGTQGAESCTAGLSAKEIPLRPKASLAKLSFGFRQSASDYSLFFITLAANGATKLSTGSTITGDLDEEVYMHLPSGYGHQGPNHARLCDLEKEVYMQLSPGYVH